MGKKGSAAAEKAVYVVVAAVYRRRGLLLVAPLVYITGMLLYMGSLAGLNVVFLGAPSSSFSSPSPGSVYRTNQVFSELRSFLEGSDNGSSSSNALMHVWDPKLRQGWRPCINTNTTHAGLLELPKSNGFLIIEANGGLNQQRLSICDAVAVAALLNATLVIPMFHFNSVWRDSSKFGDIFDEEFFIYALRNHVHVVRELPEDVLLRFDNNISSIVNLRVKAWSSPTYYLQKVLPKLVELGLSRLLPGLFECQILEVCVIPTEESLNSEA